MLFVLTQQRGKGENEAAKVHIAANEGQWLQMSGKKDPEGGGERLCLHKRFSSPAGSTMHFWELGR